MTQNTELRRKISKMGTKTLINKFEKGVFSEEELPIAKEFLTKRGYDFLPDTDVKISVNEGSSIKPVKKVKKDKKKVRKMFIDENGKERSKSDLMRRLIRANHQIKPKELNAELNKMGFDKAYHSEIQRCRQQLNVTIVK